MSDDRQRRRQRPLPRTPAALSVLSLLHERSMHPYEMRTLMRSGWASLAAARMTSPSSALPRRGPTMS